jgi:hypothetical protein
VCSRVYTTALSFYPLLLMIRPFSRGNVLTPPLLQVAAMLGPKTEEDMKPVEKKKAPKAPKVCFGRGLTHLCSEGCLVFVTYAFVKLRGRTDSSYMLMSHYHLLCHVAYLTDTQECLCITHQTHTSFLSTFMSV